MKFLTPLILAPILLAGCASTSGEKSDRAEAPPLLAPRAVPVYDGHYGEAAEWDALVAAASNVDVVVIGEMHGHDQGLAAAAALWEDVLAETADPALSLEFFERDDQAALDDYLLGVTDEEAFREATGRTGRNYPAGHRAMVEAAREAVAAVYAANAPRRYASMAREDGFGAMGSLRPSQHALFEAPDQTPKSDYRDRFFKQMSGMMASHGGEEDLTEDEIAERIEGYFRAQSVWDETMAGTIARALRNGHRPVVHVVGRFHADYDGGLIEAIRDRRPGARIVTVSMVEEAAMAGEDLGRADFVVEVGPGEPHAM